MASKPTIITSQTERGEKPFKHSISELLLSQNLLIQTEGNYMPLIDTLVLLQIQPGSNKEKDERVGSNEKIIYLHKTKALQGPLRANLHRCFRIPFYRDQRKSSFESAQLN